MTEAIRYGIRESTLYILAPERLSGLKKGKFNERVRVLSDSCTEVVFDLSVCSYLDSTFMGYLISLRKLISPRIISLTNPSPEARQILSIMGLQKIFKITLKEMPADLELTELDDKDQANSETVLEAHELLSQLSPENARRFEQVLKSLQDSIQHKKSQ